MTLSWSQNSKIILLFMSDMGQDFTSRGCTSWCFHRAVLLFLPNKMTHQTAWMRETEVRIQPQSRQSLLYELFFIHLSKKLIFLHLQDQSFHLFLHMSKQPKGGFPECALTDPAWVIPAGLPHIIINKTNSSNNPVTALRTSRDGTH